MTLSLRLNKEDEYDVKCYKKAKKEYEKNLTTYSLDEIKKELLRR